MGEPERTENMSGLEQKLSTLRRCFDMGYITEELYNEYSRRILNDWFRIPDDEKPLWKRILNKAKSLGYTVLTAVISFIVDPFRRRITEDEEDDQNNTDT